jgi:hypothetical protein
LFPNRAFTVDAGKIINPGLPPSSNRPPSLRASLGEKTESIKVTEILFYLNINKKKILIFLIFSYFLTLKLKLVSDGKRRKLLEARNGRGLAVLMGQRRRAHDPAGLDHSSALGPGGFMRGVCGVSCLPTSLLTVASKKLSGQLKNMPQCQCILVQRANNGWLFAGLDAAH